MERERTESHRVKRFESVSVSRVSRFAEENGLREFSENFRERYRVERDESGTNRRPECRGQPTSSREVQLGFPLAQLVTGDIKGQLSGPLSAQYSGLGDLGLTLAHASSDKESYTWKKKKNITLHPFRKVLIFYISIYYFYHITCHQLFILDN